MNAKIDWDLIRANKFANDAPPQDWPKGVQPISLTGTTLFGIDVKSGRLYWDGHQVVTKRRISLGGVELWLAILATAGSVMQGLSAFVPWVRSLLM